MVGESLISSSVGYEVVLFPSRLTHEKDGDHVDEVGVGGRSQHRKSIPNDTATHYMLLPTSVQIKLDVPCTVTQLQIVDARQPSDSAPCVLLRVFARDSGSAHAARFAPLVASEISCAAGRTVTCPTESVILALHDSAALLCCSRAAHSASCCLRADCVDQAYRGARPVQPTAAHSGRVPRARWLGCCAGSWQQRLDRRRWPASTQRCSRSQPPSPSPSSPAETPA
ncbi:hypothetical protein HaLaN_11818 [Haematococcus lacustris]|uniref:Uncharacterized protein n=1 Tax=Haematococcus lacustris TaxID=44745 RepID=A0A699Z1Q6_HAELA|nr:hypothetical protein HaLaN_11818 [Haematococcus lacustris]